MGKSEESLESKETPPVEPVGDEELDSAAQTTEEEVVKVEKKETKKIEPEDEEEHRERSKLGRKVKQLEDVIQQQNERMEMLMAKLETPASTNPYEDEILTEEDWKKYRAIRKKETEEQTKYSQGYIRNFYAEGKKDREGNPELYDEVYNEMAVNFNIRYSNDPSMDAALNYAKAKAAVLAKKTASPKLKPNLKGGDKPQASTNIDVKSRAAPEPSEEIELDDEAKEFVRKVGMKTESIREALKGEAPAHLSARK